MKILLVGINAKYIHPALAIYQLKLNCHATVETMEFNIKENPFDIYQKITCKEYNLIGFSCYLWNILIVKALCHLIKTNHPSTKILLGGPEVSYDASYFLTNYPVDYIIRGEGELAFSALINHLFGHIEIQHVASLSYLENGLIKNNDIILPDLNTIKLAPLTVPNYRNRVVYIESSRGCPYNCSYCCASLEKKVRFFPIDKIKALLIQLMKEKVKTVKFLDRTFNANKRYLIDILTLIEENNISTTFQFEIVVDKLDHDILAFLSTLKKKGLRFEIGIQSTNTIVNESVNRWQDMNLLKENIRFLSLNTLVDLHLDLIAGLPFETKKSFIASFNEVFLLRPKELQLGFLKFLRGTPILKTVQEHGYLYQKNPPYEIIENKYLTMLDLNEIKNIEVVLNKFYNDFRFPKTINQCFKLITNPYSFFLNLSNYAKSENFNFISYQQYDLALLFDNFLAVYFPNNYLNLSFYLKQDYLEKAKTKPKIWWNHNLTKKSRAFIYQSIIQKKPSISIDDLYRYSIVLTHNDLIYICLYKNYIVKTHLINIK